MLVCCSGRFSHLWQKDLHSFGVQPKPFPIQKQFKFALFSQIRNSVALRLFTLIPRLKIVFVSSCNTNLKILAKPGAAHVRAAGLPESRAGAAPRWLAMSGMRFHGKPRQFTTSNTVATAGIMTSGI